MQKQLRQAKAAGIVFGPANGWLTFVPYAGLAAYRSAGEARFADYLSKLTGLPVLYYCYAEIRQLRAGYALRVRQEATGRRRPGRSASFAPLAQPPSRRR